MLAEGGTDASIFPKSVAEKSSAAQAIFPRQPRLPREPFHPLYKSRTGSTFFRLCTTAKPKRRPNRRCPTKSVLTSRDAPWLPAASGRRGARQMCLEKATADGVMRVPWSFAATSNAKRLRDGHARLRRPKPPGRGSRSFYRPGQARPRPVRSAPSRGAAVGSRWTSSRAAVAYGRILSQFVMMIVIMTPRPRVLEMESTV